MKQLTSQSTNCAKALNVLSQCQLKHHFLSIRFLTPYFNTLAIFLVTQ